MRRYFFLPLIPILLASQSVQAAFDSAQKPTGKKLEIIRVVPDANDAPAGKQIVISFNRPVVPLGKMERSASEIPIITTPALSCEWRWINTTSLACNLPENAPLQESTRYSLEIKPGITAEDGATIADTYHHTFITQRPAIRYHEFRQWKSAGFPILRLVFNQPVDKESVAEHVFLGVGDKGQARVKLKPYPDPNDRELPRFMPVPGENYALLFDKQPKQKSDDALVKNSGKEARRVWLVEPLSELSANTHVVLKTEAGLASPLGAERSIESSEVVQFDTYPPFAFLSINCVNNRGNALEIKAGETSTQKCDPMQPVKLTFSSPVERSKMGRMLSFNPPVGGWTKAGEDEAEGEYSEASEPSGEIGWQYRQPHSKDRTYEVWVPSGLKAAQEYTVRSRMLTMNIFERLWHWLKSWFVHVPPVDVVDIFGRELQQPVSSQFATDHRNPNLVFEYRDAVLEKGVDSEIPFYVNNLNSYTVNYNRLTSKGADKAQVFTRDIPKVQDVQFAIPLGLREMLSGGSGAIYGYLTSDPTVPNYYNRRLFAQVTPYQVHLKLGHFNSIVWVTDMATGAPVEGAKVSVYKDTLPQLQVAKTPEAKVTTDASGVAVLPGTATLDPDLQFTLRQYRDEDMFYFVRVDKGDDMALLQVGQSFQINNWRMVGGDAYPSAKQLYGHMQAWGTTAQGIYRAGDTIQYKIYVRNQDNNGFVPAPKKGYALKVLDPMGKVVHHEKDITLSEFGGTSGEFVVPKSGAVGWYQFKLIAGYAAKSDNDPSDATEAPEESVDGRVNEEVASGDASNKKTLTPMRVLVSDFTPAAFKVSNQLNGDLFRAGQQVDVTTRAELHSGGAYTDASARITAMLDSAAFVSKNPIAKGYQFDSFSGETSSQQIFQKIDSVNNKGELALSFPMGSPKVVYGKLTVESAVADDRGKFITHQSSADYVGVDRLVGLHSNDWLYSVGKPASVNYLVVDERGNPAKGTQVSIAIEHEVSKAARVKGAGNAYITQYHTEWEAAGSCKGLSDEKPIECSFTPEKAGVYRAVASIKDSKGNDHSTTLSAYATGRDFVVWNDEGDSGLTIVPESTSYKVGDKARYLVKNPYPGAKALITIERYGVLERFVQTFDSSTPVVEFEVKPDYLPGFYLSVLVFSPRVDKPLGEGQVDLGKPSFRMGYVSVPVKDPYKEMVVTAKTDRDIYKPRDKVTVTLHAQPRMKDKKEPIELTVAVLDEAVFDLISSGKSYFDPYNGFYKLDALDVRNYSLLTRLVGRQKFEKKGANPGGDGGADLSMRSLFKFVSYWNAELVTDKDGNATASFEAPDNLTGWRVLAIATTPSDRFGLGDVNFKVNRPTEVRPVMPNQVMEGDVFDAGFSVMNRTEKLRILNVTIRAEGNIDTVKTPASITQTVTLEPYKRTTVTMPVATTAVEQKSEVAAGKLTFTVTARDDEDGDGMTHELDVHKHRSLEIAVNYGTTTQEKVEESIAFPKDMLPDVGGVSVVASPTVIGNVSGAFKYMRDYPYMCWEQKLSKGVIASHYKNLKAYLPDALEWKDSESLSQSTLDQAASFQAPNGGMTYFIAQDKYVDPYLSAYTAIAFNWLRKSGYNVPEQVETKLHTYLNSLLKNHDVPDFYSEGMTSTVRAVALAALAERGKVSLSDIERYVPHVPKMSLFGKSYFLQAAMAVKGSEKYWPDVARMILAASNQTGGKFVFSEERDDSYSRILASPLRENCVVLSAFTALGEHEQGKKLVGDVPFKLVRTITQDRKNRDHWENTQENMFCMNALIEFARIYEKDAPDMTVRASMDNAIIGQTLFKDVRNPAVLMERPHHKNDAGRTTPVVIERSGTGRLYYATRLMYALPASATKAANAGIEIRREYSVERAGKWEILTSPAEIARGELVRVDLYLSVPAARNFVVVDDAVAGGLEPVNRDLATASLVDANKGEFTAAGGSFWFKYSDWIDFGVNHWSFYHKEIRHDSVRYYADYLPAGNYHLSYTAQAIATGTFSVLPAMAQEMYDPDVYGKTDGLSLKVTQKQELPQGAPKDNTAQ